MVSVRGDWIVGSKPPLDFAAVRLAERVERQAIDGFPA
jgi:hypothetical protein